MKIASVGMVACFVSALLFGCSRQQPNSTTGKSNQKTVKTSETTSKSSGKKRDYVFAMIAKSQSNPVFQAARVGAEDAVRDLSKKLGFEIKLEWRTPNEDDAQKQAEAVEQLVAQGVDGISISCSIADTLTPAINTAVDRGVAVMCFDSDAPASKRFCYYGTDDIDSGRTILRELAAVLGPGKHVVAIPGGNQNAVNLQNRIRGVKEEAAKYPDITLRGVYYSKETPQDAAAKVEEVQTTNPDIDGWAMIGAWSLFTDALMKWQPGRVKIVAMDALPAQLPYVEKGIVAKLYAQQTYLWGYRSMELLADKIILGKPPKQMIEYSPLLPVTKENVREFSDNWKKWLRQ
jgi:ribose transport system substrate-binding protein